MPQPTPRMPFEEAIESLQRKYELTRVEAIDRVQTVYDKFKDRTQILVSREDDRSNAAQTQLVSHFALLATLILTVTGLLLTQTTGKDVLTDWHKILILIILVCEGVSIVFGAVEYLLAIWLHRTWAKIHKSIDEQVDAMFADKTLQRTSQLNEIEEIHTSQAPRKTPMAISWAMIGFCISGMAGLILLFYTFFFDVPLM